MARYVNIRELFDQLYDADAITAKGIEIVRNFPVVDIVRCKDCLYSYKTPLSLQCEKHHYVWNDHEYYVDDDNFCCWGVRKDSDEE